MQEECCKASVDQLDKEDLLRLFACLQSELEAREIALEALKNEKLHCINLRSKYGIINGENKAKGFEDPFVALQRDSLVAPSGNNSEAALKPLYDTQLLQLETLIASQRYAQNKMREQLIVMEKRYLKACEELEEERRKHESDAAQGDDVLVMLEKERERLKSEVEYERQQNKKLVRELKRALSGWKEQDALCRKQKLAGVNIVKERRQLISQLSSEQKRVAELECALNASNNGSVTSKNDTPITDGVKTDKEENTGSVYLVDKSACLCPECELLKKKLAQEVSSRKALQANFERLKQEFQKLAMEVNRKDPSTTFDHSARSMSASPTNTELRISTTVSNCSKELTSGMLAQRPKPHPPTRRSSEISSSSPPSTSSQVPLSGSDSNLLVSDQHSPDGENYPPTSCISVDVEPCAPILNTNTEVSIETSSSRSSTPSPPPPPPLVQLYYPYPGMQNHLGHSTSRGPFISSSNTRSSSILNHGTSPSTKSRMSVPPSTTQLNPPYQSPFPVAVQSVLVSNRPQITTGQTSRPNISRKPATVNIQHSQFHSPSNQSIFVQSQAKPPNASQFNQRNGPTSVSHSYSTPVGGHHFPAFTPHRPHSSITNSISSGPRPRSSAQSNATSLTATSVGGTGHVCVNGK